jgi:hypothetical protein
MPAVLPRALRLLRLPLILLLPALANWQSLFPLSRLEPGKRPAPRGLPGLNRALRPTLHPCACRSESQPVFEGQRTRGQALDLGQ